MSGFWETTKQLASSGADATARATKRTKLRADISLKERKIRQLKEEFGTKVYPLFNETSAAQSCYNTYKEKIDILLAKIEKKRGQIKALEQPRSVTSGGSSGGSGRGGRQFAGSVPPPPRPTKPSRMQSKGVQARALYDYTAGDDEEISLRKGDLVDISNQDGAWWIGSVKGGKSGSFPSNYVTLEM